MVSNEESRNCHCFYSRYVISRWFLEFVNELLSLSRLASEDSLTNDFTVLILGSLRYATYMGHVQEEERKKMEKLGNPTNSAEGSSSSFTIPSRSIGTQTEAGQAEAVLAEVASSGKAPDAGAGLVSLG